MPLNHQAKQLFLDKINIMNSKISKEHDIEIINWNISNPSKQRAEKQVKWLIKIDPDIIALTETKFSKGCLYIRDRLKSWEYNVLYPQPDEKEYGVLLATKHHSTPTNFSKQIDYLNARIVSVIIPHITKELEFIVTYVPNERSEKKKYFLQKLLKAFKSTFKSNYRIFCGDFNVLEPDHIPHYRKFEDWEYDFYKNLKNYNLIDAFRHLNPNAQEYSWVGRTGDGYRYDHCFVSENLLTLVDKCYYIHEPRINRLSDHSAMYIKIIQ